MSRQSQSQGPNNYPILAGEDGEYVKRIALEKKRVAHASIQSVYDLVPSQFHKNIRLLSQKEKILDKQFNLTAEQRAHGLHSYYGKTYIETFRPYVDVEGRIEQMIDVHKNHGKSYELNIFPEQVGDCWVMVCVFDGLNKNGQSFKTKERAIIGFGAQSGVDSTNPIENASTSAVGRALSHGGYGNIGSGLSSYEDVYIAISKQKALEKLKNDGKESGGAEGQRPTGQQPDNRGSSQGRGNPSQGSGQQPQGSGQSSRSSNANHSQQNPNANRSTNDRGQGQPNAGQEEKNRQKEKNKIVSRLMNGTQNWSKPELKNKVQTVIQQTWDGKFNSLSLEQLELLEERLGEGQQAS